MDSTTTAAYNAVYRVIERALHPEELPAIADPTIARTTQAVFRALRLDQQTAHGARSVTGGN